LRADQSGTTLSRRYDTSSGPRTSRIRGKLHNTATCSKLSLFLCSQPIL